MSDEEGEFQEGQELAENDSFEFAQNGIYMRLADGRLVFPGYRHMHLFNPESKTFSVIKNYE
jgi:hypothetical protein